MVAPQKNVPLRTPKRSPTVVNIADAKGSHVWHSGSKEKCGQRDYFSLGMKNKNRFNESGITGRDPSKAGAEGVNVDLESKMRFEIVERFFRGLRAEGIEPSCSSPVLVNLFFIGK